MSNEPTKKVKPEVWALLGLLLFSGLFMLCAGYGVAALLGACAFVLKLMPLELQRLIVIFAIGYFIGVCCYENGKEKGKKEADEMRELLLTSNERMALYQARRLDDEIAVRKSERLLNKFRGQSDKLGELSPERPAAVVLDDDAGSIVVDYRDRPTK